jgi:hypothetical protein
MRRTAPLTSRSLMILSAGREFSLADPVPVKARGAGPTSGTLEFALPSAECAWISI